MKKIDLMIFDLDGTLVSSGKDLAQAINFTLKEMKLPQKNEGEIISFVGDGVRNLVEKAMETQQTALVDKALDIFSDYYGKHFLDNTKLYPYVLDVLKNFRNKIKVILTNKRNKFSLPIVRALKIEQHFSDIIGGDSFSYKKPDPHLIDHLLQKYDITKDKTVMIGDGVNDVRVAKNSGILSVIFLNGLGERKVLLAENADYYCESLIEINSLFI